MSQTVGMEGWATGLGSLRSFFLCGMTGVSESPSRPGLPQQKGEGGETYSRGWLKRSPRQALGNEEGDPGELAKVNNTPVETRLQRKGLKSSRCPEDRPAMAPAALLGP